MKRWERAGCGDSPEESALICLFILTFSSEGVFGPLGSLSLESFLFSFSCSDSPLEENVWLSHSSSTKISPAERAS